MDKIYANQTGGFPLTTNILNAMQNAYNIFNSLGSLAGNYTIISGCEETGNNISDGVVYINGELLPFKGGIKISKVRIVENTESKQFEDGQTKTVLFKRFAQFGTGVNAIDWSKFKRPNALLQIMKRLDDLEARPTFYVGMVLLWNRPASEIPQGFEPYTEMAGRTPIGLDPNYSYNTNEDIKNHKFDTLGAIGGEREVQLVSSELPRLRGKFRNLSNTHSQGICTSTVAGDAHVGGVNVPQWKHKDVTINIGADKAHTNMPPYKIVQFIKYVGI